MSGQYSVRFDPEAIAALEEAANYIESDSSTERARTWLRAMLSSIENLESFPRAFPAESRRGKRSIRSKLVMSHRVFYFVDDGSNIVYIVDVVHTAQDTKLRQYRKD
ncbi:MAG: type II toxin-antitoxin system RelE/ParE family toxin [Acidobacteriota bacterium]